MRRAVLALLAALGVAAALGVTASSTMRQAIDAGMTGAVLGVPVALCLVIVLEVVNVAGTWTWLSEATRAVKIEAAVFVGLASVVTGTCGALTYGPIGLVAPVGVLAAVRLLDRLLAPVPSTPSPPTAAVTAAPRTDAQRPGEQPDPPTAPSSPAPAAAPTRPAHGAHAQGADDEVIVAALLARPDMPGRDAVKTEFRVGTKKAERVIAQADARRRPHLLSAEGATS